MNKQKVIDFFEGLEKETQHCRTCKHRKRFSLNGEQMLAFDAHTTRFYEKENFKPAPSSPRLEDDVPF